MRSFLYPLSGRPLFVVILALGWLAALWPAPVMAGEGGLNILCTTFPIYQITKNLTQGRGSAQVALLLPAQLGCPHDYALTPKDMQLLARADVLVINGLGLEEFLGTLRQKTAPRLSIIDSAKGVSETIAYAAEPAPTPRQGHKGHEGHDAHDAHEAGVNPHLFVSPRLAARLAMSIAGELARIDPAGAGVYQSNGRAYADKMGQLDQELVGLGQRLKNRRIITQHGVFAYLARDLGLEVVAVVQAHAGQEPSAAEMLAIIKTARETKAGAIFSEPQYPAKVVQTIAREAGIPAATLDPVASGPDGAALDHYEKTMRQNMATLKSTLGTL